MRISDWSSDVCSSDLQRASHASGKPEDTTLMRCCALFMRCCAALSDPGQQRLPHRFLGPGADHHADVAGRSEEHTSELQSLMRTSYTVFCLKKNILEKTTCTRKTATTRTINSTPRIHIAQ